jgi:4'-phosphopantetheinyl transferase
MTDQTSWQEPPSHLALGSGQVHLWCARLDVVPALEAHFYSCLSADERSRADRFHFATDRSRFVVSRGVLRELLGSYLRLAPASVVISKDERDKPFVPSNREPNLRGRLRFNASHSESLAVFAFAEGFELGIDIEYIQRALDFEAVAESHFTESEKAQLGHLAPAARREAFFLGWTRKEAYLKATGEGLRVSLDSVEVPLKAEPGPILLKNRVFPVCTVYPLIPSPDFVGAIAAEGTGHDLRCWKWTRQG